jgi:hypothetical protein
MKRPAVVLGLLYALVLLTRLCHSGIVWVEEAYPASAAIQILHGQAIYRDFWFDKPPLSAWFYLLWGGYTGVPLRLAGSLFVLACSITAYRFAGRVWSEREGVTAAVLLAFYLTFGIPSAIMALAPDLLMVLPHLGAAYLAWKGRPFAAGVVAGIAMLVNPKAIFVLAACLLWQWRGVLNLRPPVSLLAGFIVVNAAGLTVLALTGALPGYFEQVWAWGSLYSRDTFYDQPLIEGARRTLAWVGFHATAVIAAVYCWRQERRWRFALWAGIAMMGVVAGLRFFPRYYFLLLPAMIIPASRGLWLLPGKARLAAAAFLLIPVIRFAPRYATLAADVVNGRETQWADVAMNRDSARVAAILADESKAGDTLLVWGYRPDILMYTRMPLGTRFLDSQPLTGVIADRHLTHSEPSAPELAAGNRRRLTAYRPTFIIDGLGLFNPSLAITNYPDLARWLDRYDEIARTGNSIVYRLRR